MVLYVIFIIFNHHKNYIKFTDISKISNLEKNYIGDKRDLYILILEFLVSMSMKEMKLKADDWLIFPGGIFFVYNS